MTPRAVVFDIGNVLIYWNPEGFFETALGKDRSKKLFAEVDLLGMNAAVDLGADFHSAVRALADSHPDWEDEILMWQDRWIEMASPAIDHSVRLLRSLRRAGVPVFALSNFGLAPFRVAEANYPFLEEFDLRILSGALEIAKPDSRIYAALEEQSGFHGAELLFTDDRQENIDAADARGWQTHLFDGPAGWGARLVAAGLLSSEDSE